jgi:hypothetical protein
LLNIIISIIIFKMLLAMGGFRVGFWDRRAKLYKVEDFKTLINTHTLPGQTEGFKVGCGGMGG